MPACIFTPFLAPPRRAQRPPDIRVTQTADAVHVDTDLLEATINKTGYVSGIAAGSFLDKTSARDLGFGLHITDFLMAQAGR